MYLFAFGRGQRGIVRKIKAETNETQGAECNKKKKKTLISGRQEGQSELEEDMITKTRSWRCARSGQCSGS